MFEDAGGVERDEHRRELVNDGEDLLEEAADIGKQEMQVCKFLFVFMYLIFSLLQFESGKDLKRDARDLEHESVRTEKEKRKKEE